MKPATTTLAELRGGLAVEELGSALRSATEAVKETGKKAVVTLKLTIRPNGHAEPGDIQSVFVDDDVSMKLPVPSRRASVFFVTEHHDLARQQTIAGIERDAHHEPTIKSGKEAAVKE